MGFATHHLGFWVSDVCLTFFGFKVLGFGFGMCRSLFIVLGFGCGTHLLEFRVWDVVPLTLLRVYKV